MFKKLKNNNKGVDITLLGTSWLLLAVVCFCSIFDIYMITQTKESVISYTKACELVALSKNFDAEKAYETQNFTITEDVREDIISTFLEQFNKSVVNNKSNPAVKVMPISESNCEVYATNNSIILKVKGINFTSQTLFKNPQKVPFFGGETSDFSGHYISSSVATKIVFFGRR